MKYYITDDLNVYLKVFYSINKKEAIDNLDYWSEKELKRYKNKTRFDISDITLIDNYNAIQKLYTTINYFNDSVIGIDFETDMVDSNYAEIKGIGISNGDDINIYIVYDSSYRTIIIDVINHLNDNCTLVAHNAKYEYKCCLNNYGIKLQLEDTIIMAYLIYNQPSDNLKLSKLANDILNRQPYNWFDLLDDKWKKITTIDTDKLLENGYSHSGIETIDIDILAPYCAEDAYETVLLYHYFINILAHDKGLYYVYKNIDLPNIYPLSDMEQWGIQFDEDIANRINEDIDLLLEVLKDEIHIIANEEFNINSNKQLQYIFYKKLNIPTDNVRKLKTGYSTDTKTRQSLKEYPIVGRVDEFLKAAKQRQQYTTNFLKHCDFENIIRCNFNSVKTVTGRLSCTNPNMQNMTSPAKAYATGNKTLAEICKAIRSQFVARDGYQFVAIDYSSFEFRILAHLSGSEVLKDVYVNNKDFHSIVAAKLFNIDNFNRKIKKHDELRTVTKTINYGIAYGMSKFRLYQECKLRGLDYSLEACDKIINDYFNELPLVKMFFDECKAYSITNGYLQSLYGRKRLFEFKHPLLQEQLGCSYNDATEFLKKLEYQNAFKIPNDMSQLRACMNFPLQSGNADAIRIAINNVYNFIKDKPFINIVLNIHDELIFEIENDYIHEYSHKLKSIMESAINLGDIPVICDMKFSDNWAGCK